MTTLGQDRAGAYSPCFAAEPLLGPPIHQGFQAEYGQSIIVGQAARRTDGALAARPSLMSTA